MAVADEGPLGQDADESDGSDQPVQWVTAYLRKFVDEYTLLTYRSGRSHQAMAEYVWGKIPANLRDDVLRAMMPRIVTFITGRYNVKETPPPLAPATQAPALTLVAGEASVGDAPRRPPPPSQGPSKRSAMVAPWRSKLLLSAVCLDERVNIHESFAMVGALEAHMLGDNSMRRSQANRRVGEAWYWLEGQIRDAQVERTEHLSDDVLAEFMRRRDGKDAA